MYISEVLDTSLEERYAFFSDFLFDLYLNALTFDYVSCLFWQSKAQMHGNLQRRKKNHTRQFFIFYFEVLLFFLKEKQGPM